MRHKRLFQALMIVGVIFVLAGGSVDSLRSSAQAAGLRGTLSRQAPAGTSFTYQGRLTDSGGAAAGPCDFQFSLWDATAGGSQVGTTQTKTNVALSDGYFSSSLDFGPVFEGSPRYLQVAVRCPAGSGNYTSLGGRIELTPAPYAQSLRPGATITGDGPVVTVEDTYSGIFATTALVGRSTQGTGVLGESLGSVGIGVEGRAALAGTGIQGETVSGYGVYGKATGSSGVTYGVYGMTGSPTGYGIYSEGNAHVEGNLTWQARTGYLSIPASALQPNTETIDWDLSTSGGYLWSNGSAYYIAPVMLPHNATVTGIQTWWKDASSGDASLELRRIEPFSTPDYVTMATLETSGQGNFVSVETSIAHPTIDNAQYSYVLRVNLPDSNIHYVQTVIEYTTTGPN